MAVRAVFLSVSFAVSTTAASAQVYEDHPENTWVRPSPRPGKPAPRFGWEGSGAYDPAGDRWIHQGGHDGTPQGFALFTFDLGTGEWEQRFPDTSPPGSCCVDGANVFDTANRRFVRFPGAALGHGWQWSRGVKLKSSPVWLYDPEANSWMNMRPPPYQAPEKYSREVLGSLNAGAAYDANHEVALSFGGQGAAGGMNNLFAYDAYANLLERLPAREPPEPRDGHGIAYDAKNDCLVVFGSQYGNDARTWIYRYATNRWEGLAIDPHPPARKGETYATIPRMAYDDLHGITLCLTWDDATGEHQTWALDLAARRWRRLRPAKEPETSASRSRNLSFSARRNLFILELVSKERGPEMWTYRYGPAPETRRPSPPAGLELATAKGRAALRWEPSAGAVKYKVYRARAEKAWEAEFELLGDAREATFEDSGLEEGAVYFYRVAAAGPGGEESPPSAPARTQLRVLLEPVVSVLAPARVEVSWEAHPAPDIAGYNVYRGAVSVETVKKGTGGAWKDNDPEYPEPVVVAVRDITGIAKLNTELVTGNRFTDTGVDLAGKSAASGDYRYAVYAYILRAVNRLGTESGPSPYALTIPSAPRNVFLRERDGAAELRWHPAREKAIAGYRVYEITAREVASLAPELVRETTFRSPAGGLRRYAVVAVDVLGQEGEPSSPVWYGRSYDGFFEGEWHQ